MPQVCGCRASTLEAGAHFPNNAKISGRMRGRRQGKEDEAAFRGQPRRDIARAERRNGNVGERIGMGKSRDGRETGGIVVGAAGSCGNGRSQFRRGRKCGQRRRRRQRATHCLRMPAVLRRRRVSGKMQQDSTRQTHQQAVSSVTGQMPESVPDSVHVSDHAPCLAACQWENWSIRMN